MTPRVRPGIESLLREGAAWLDGARVGLVCHPASVTSGGLHSSIALRRAIGSRLVCLFGPEHGVTGRGGAGEKMPHGRHPRWKIPIHSLYGDTRRPTAAMLEGVDAIVFDLQDLGARPYTYVATLRYLLEAAAEHGKRFIVADRPAPLAGVVDGPMLEPDFESFVSGIPSPVVYGMTSGETALWLRRTLKLDVDLRVARVSGYRRQARPRMDWVPPSPAIVSWDSALCFPVTVFFEALPVADHGRGTATPFQTLAAPKLDAVRFCGRLRELDLPGVKFAPCSYEAAVGALKGRPVQGVRIKVVKPHAFKPVRTGVAMIQILQELIGRKAVWEAPGTRPEFFDLLMGTDSVRKALLAGKSAKAIAAAWTRATKPFLRAREACRLY